jgi:hypothetical protein
MAGGQFSVATVFQQTTNTGRTLITELDGNFAKKNFFVGNVMKRGQIRHFFVLHQN